MNGVQSQITDIQQSWLETCNHSVGRDALKKVTTVQIRIHNTGDVPCKFTNQQDINTLVVDYHSGYLSVSRLKNTTQPLRIDNCLQAALCKLVWELMVISSSTKHQSLSKVSTAKYL